MTIILDAVNRKHIILYSVCIDFELPRQQYLTHNSTPKGNGAIRCVYEHDLQVWRPALSIHHVAGREVVSYHPSSSFSQDRMGYRHTCYPFSLSLRACLPVVTHKLPYSLRHVHAPHTQWLWSCQQYIGNNKDLKHSIFTAACH